MFRGEIINKNTLHFFSLASATRSFSLNDPHRITKYEKKPGGFFKKQITFRPVGTTKLNY